MENILVEYDEKLTLKIGDFELATNEDFSNVICGFVILISVFLMICRTPLYMGPEMFSENEKYSKKVDIWSFGVILYKMIFGYIFYLFILLN
jgi:serine/threonine protein kinase